MRRLLYIFLFLLPFAIKAQVPMTYDTVRYPGFGAAFTPSVVTSTYQGISLPYFRRGTSSVYDLGVTGKYLRTYYSSKTNSDLAYIQNQYATKQAASAWIDTIKADKHQFTAGYINYTSLNTFPYHFKATGSAININTVANQNLNLSLASNSALTFSGSNHWGISFQPSTTGPDFGTDIGSFSYRLPTESMPKNFWLFRGGQYVFESDDASWQLILTPTGANFGSPADNTLVPMSRLEVDGSLSVGHTNARHFAAPSNGLMVQGPAIFGLTSVINVNDAISINGRASITGDVYQTGQDNYTVEPTYTSLTKTTKGYNDATYATITTVNGKVGSVTGTTNQVIVGGTATNPILSLPQNINSGASPTFNALTLGSTLTTSGLIRQSLSNGSADIAEFINTSPTGYGAYVQGGNTTNFAFKVTNYAGVDAMSVLGNGNMAIAGNLTTITPTSANHAATKDYVDSKTPYRIYMVNSYTSVGTSGTTFTVSIGLTMPDANYNVLTTPKNAATANTDYYITNKTTTSFDIIFSASMAASTASFDWVVCR